MNYKVKFPGGYNVKSDFNDNIDVHFILENGRVFFATLFTIANVEKLMNRDGYFWCADMLIIPDLKIESIKTVFNKMLKDEEVDFDVMVSEIGTIIDVYGLKITYKSLKDEIQKKT